ncbi:MAG: amino acid permease [Rhabdochlamydiaceae bacterium]|nr:amino acid permease [Candidatus Amphrikana amoebophyrae]
MRRSLPCFFFIPIALVSAELATGWPEKGGVYVWAKAAFGERWGFFTTWLQWIYSMLGIISTLYFGSSSLGYLIYPPLSNSPTFLITASIITVWFFTALNLRGQSMSSKISSLGFTLGVLVPAALIIALGIGYLFTGQVDHLNLSWSYSNLLPDFSDFTTFVLLVGFMRAFGGIEAAASHANLVENPQRNYPISILIVVIIGLAINIFGSLSVAVVIPTSDLSLAAGLIDAFSKFFTIFNMGWLTKPIAALITWGALGSVSTWLMGPIKGLLATAENGDIMPFLSKTNKHDAPSHLLIIQACFISIIAFFLLMMPNINLAFWLSVAIAMTVYLTMYFMLLLSGLVLRYKHPDVHRNYRVPFGKFGIWLNCLVGMATIVFAFTVDLFPPMELHYSKPKFYICMLAGSAIILWILPHIIYTFRNESWKKI